MRSHFSDFSADMAFYRRFNNCLVLVDHHHLVSQQLTRTSLFLLSTLTAILLHEVSVIIDVAHQVLAWEKRVEKHWANVLWIIMKMNFSEHRQTVVQTEQMMTIYFYLLWGKLGVSNAVIILLSISEFSPICGNHIWLWKPFTSFFSS